MIKHLDPILFLAVASLPIYLLPSGNLQPSHYLLGIYCGALLISKGVGRGSAETMLAILAIIVLFRESVEVIIHGTPMSLLPAAHVIYSAIVFNALRRALSSERALKFVLFGIVMSAAVAVGGVMIFGYSLIADSYLARPVGTFRNANQVGYFAVCLFSLAFFFRLRFQLSGLVLILLVVCSLFLAIVSLSKAAMIGIATASIFAGVALTNRRGQVLVGGSIVALSAFGVYWLYSSGSLDDFSFIRRLEGIGSENDDSLVSRGYGLIFDGTALTLLAGFGSVETITRLNHEVHSTIFGFFVHYGIFAGILFLAFICLWVRRVWRLLGISGLLLVVSPVMLYGITHNGSRFAIFWVLLALTFADAPRRSIRVRSSIDANMGQFHSGVNWGKSLTQMR